MAETPKVPDHLQRWIAARDRFGLSHAQVQMARELKLNVRKLGQLVHRHSAPEPQTLAQVIEMLYRQRFGRDCPDQTLSIEERTQQIAKRNQVRRLRKAAEQAKQEAAQRKAAAAPPTPEDSANS